MQRAKRMFKKTRKRNRPRRQFLFIPIENPSILRLRYGFAREKAFSFLSFFPGGAARAVCLTLLQADGPTFLGGRSHMPLSSGSPVPVLTSPFIGPFLGRCRRNCYRRHRSHFVNAADYSEFFREWNDSDSEERLPGAHSKSKATMESKGKP